MSQKPTFDHVDVKGLPGALEAEKLQILEATPAHGRASVGPREGIPALGETAPGDKLKLRFDAPRPERRPHPGARPRQERRHRPHRVNGREIARDLDCTHPQSLPRIEFKKVPLRKDSNELEFTIGIESRGVGVAQGRRRSEDELRLPADPQFT